jgi:hypothetical protein
MAAESWDIELKLINGGLVGPAKQSADVLRALETQMENTSSAFEDALNNKVKKPFDEAKKSAKGFEDEVQKAMAQAGRLAADPKGFQLLAKAKKDLADQRKKLLDDAGLAASKKPPNPPGGSGPGGSFGKGFYNEMGFAKLAGAEAIGGIVAGGVLGAAHILIAGAEKFVNVVTDGVKSAFREGSKYENLKLGYKLSLRGTEAEDSMNDVGRFSKMTGFDDDVINNMLLPLRRAGFDRQGARSAFAAASDIAAGNGRGGDQGFVQSILEGFNHIMLKGGIQERRLPELGVNAKQFYGDLAKTLKTTTDTAKKLAEEGKINPQLLLNTIYKGVEQRQGGKLGTGGIAYGKTMQARLAKIEDLPNQYFKAVAESPRWDELSDKFGSVLEQLDPDSPKGKRIVDSIMNAFGTLADVAERVFTPENIDAFVVGMVKVVDLAERLFRAVGPLIDTALTIGKYADAGVGDPQSAIASTLSNYIVDKFHIGKSGSGATAENSDSGDYYNNGRINPVDFRPFMRGPSVAKATQGNVHAPVEVNVTIGGGVDATNAKQTGQAVGEEAGRVAALYIGRVAQESGSR